MRIWPFKKKPAPELWDGVHRLVWVREFEDCVMPEDYTRYWCWKCACGAVRGDRFTHDMPDEEACVENWKKHRDIWKGLGE